MTATARQPQALTVSDHPGSDDGTLLKPMMRRTRYCSENGRSCIDLKIRHSRQLFDGRDPAPFIERDLDGDAAAYLLGAAQEIPRKQPLAR